MKKQIKYPETAGWLKSARHQLLMNQRQLAQALNISDSRISHYAAGRNELPATLMLKIKEMIKCIKIKK